MSSVASPALKPVPSPAPPPAAAPASNSAPVSPFDSLLDDGSQSAAPPPPQPASAKVPATQAPPPQPASAKAPPTQAPPTASAAPPTTDGGTQANAVIMPAQPDMAVQTINTAGNPKPSDAQAVSEFKPDAGVPAQAGQSTGGAQGTDATAASGDQTPGGVQGTDGKVTLDAKAVVQAAAGGLKPVSKDKPADQSKAPDDDAVDAPDAGQPQAATGANVVATVLATVTAPVTPGPGKPAAKDAAIVADGTPKPQPGIAAPLQAAFGKSVSDGKADEKTAAQSGGKPQPATADTDKQPNPTVAPPADHHAAADTQSPVNHGAPAVTAKTVDASPPPPTLPPPATVPTQNAAPAASAPAPLALPQAVAIPLSGVAIEIAGKALAGKNHFEIRLDPPELGRIEVRLDVDRDGRITSHVIADRRDTLDLLQRDASGLQRAFHDAGLKTSDNGLQFSLRDQSTGQQQQNPSSPNPASAQLVAEDDVPINAMPSSSLARLSGGLDIRV